MKFRFSVLLLLFLFSSNLKAQTDTSPLDTLFEGGKEIYDQLAKSFLNFPKRIAGENIYGTHVYEITVLSSGEVQAKMMTKVHPDFENQTIGFIQASNTNWIRKPFTYKIYQPIFYGYPSDEGDYVSESIGSFPTSFDFPVLEPISEAIIVTRVTSRTPPRKLSEDKGLTLGDIGLDKIPQPGDMPSEKQRMAILNSEMHKYLKNESKFLKHLEKGNEARAFEFLSDMIRFNPFDSELIRQRMELAQELRITDYMAYDTPWLLALRRMGR